MQKVLLILLCACVCSQVAHAQNFRFALLTDLHIAAQDTIPTSDLRAAVCEINATDSIDFVLVLGDITEKGDIKSLQQAKIILDSLRVKYYVTSGNHETKISYSGAADFAAIFGADKFAFSHQICHFLGFNTGPKPNAKQGLITQQDLQWLTEKLEHLPNEQPIFICTHYPLQQGDVENWREATDMLRRYNVQVILGGHYHRNVLLNCGGICNVLHRSTLRGKHQSGGYTLITITPENIFFQEKEIGALPELWLTLPLERKNYD